MSNDKGLLSGSITILIGAVIAIMALVRGPWQAWLLIGVFTLWGLWVVLILLLPYMQQAKRRRHPPQAGDSQPPVIYQQANRDNGRGDVGAVQVSQHMGPDVLHAVHIAHEGLGQVRQIPLAEVAQGQLAQPLRQAETGGLHLVID